MRSAGVAIVAAVALAACGERPRPPTPIDVPARAVTAGDPIWARLPAGAALVLEVDLARLRSNAALGAVARDVIDGGGLGEGAPTAALVDAELVVLAAYALGRPDAHTITIVRGGHRPDTAVALDDELWALTDDGVTPTLVAVTPATSLATDDGLRALRAAVMPEAATGAALRLTARLDDDARRGLAESFDTTAPPSAAAVWLDVADDVAAVVWLDGIAATMAADWRARVAALREIRLLGLAPSIAATRLAATTRGTTATVVIGPGRLARAVARWQAHRQLSP